jgi:hypothetical protein
LATSREIDWSIVLVIVKGLVLSWEARCMGSGNDLESVLVRIVVNALHLLTIATFLAFFGWAFWHLYKMFF